MSCTNKVSYDKFEPGLGPKLRRRCCSALAGLAVLALLALIVFVWVQVGHAAFKPKRFYNVTVEARTTPAASRATFNDSSKKALPNSHLDDLGDFADVEYVKPMKIGPLPLHDHDILYDMMRNNQDHPPIRHHSGHFRHMSAEVWDPHPQYEIDAFGLKMVLELAHNGGFVAPTLQVTQVWDNYTQRTQHDPKDVSGCYYTGTVRGDAASKVVVSLCNGMTGFIKTSDGNYHIEPAEHFQDNTITSILHRIKRISSKEESNNIELDLDQCETKIGDNLEHEHLISKRAIADDEEPQRQIHSSTSPYFIEIMVVTDKKMTQYHGSQRALIHYVLTLMSHVALLFKDATIGNPISLAVVDIMILEDTEFTSVTSQEMFRKFCEYQHNHSRRNHDVALLLTREVICKNATMHYCSTLGVAEVRSMCTPTASCAIVRDKGLSTSYTIAHELGHVLSMPHDDDKKCLKFNGGVKQNNIMSKMLHNDTKPWHWSTCSKHFLTEFLDSPRSRCLLDVPEKDFITEHSLHERLPGERFLVDKQCELEFGAGSKICSFMPYCGSLWCTTEFGEEEGCKTQYMPWADGTACGRDRWCHHGKCIALDRNLLSPIAGGWGNWHAWGPCTRSCGGGIRMSKRDCNNPAPANGGPYCTGGMARYSSCNPQPCETDDPDFREQQCAEFNGHTKGLPGLTTSVKWVPKYGASDPDDFCKLYCRVKHSSAYYELKEKVVDGTKCGLNSFDICVNGICQSGGCDNELGSNTTLDDCGVCRGDNSKCEVMTGFYNMSTYGYNMVALIPKGSSNIIITQAKLASSDMTSDDNYLVLKDSDTEDYILNGNLLVSTYPKDIIYGGLTVKYSGSNESTERITTPRNSKLTKDMILEVLSVGTVMPPDIKYVYTISRDSAPKYGWDLYGESWSHCSSICNGEQHLHPICKDLAQNLAVKSSLCSGPKVSDTSKCNVHCKLIWRLSSRGHCSAQCGSGLRPLYYDCVKEGVLDGEQEVVDEKHCRLLSPPTSQETCIGECASTRWEYDEWSQCSKSCGGGLQTRSAKCVDETSSEINESHCNQRDRYIQKNCNTDQCPTWSFDEWSPCSTTCGKGFKTRPYFCQSNGQIYDPSHCNRDELPAVQEDCSLEECHPKNAKWLTGNWSSCSASCGEGRQTREVVCVSDFKQINEHHCRSLLKPNSTRTCHESPCKDDYYEENAIYSGGSIWRWKTGQWGQCSRSCNGGVMTRMVACLNEHGVEDESFCSYKDKPVSSVKCKVHACPKWKVGGWSRCDPHCEQRRHLICQDSEGSSIDHTGCDQHTRPHVVGKCKKGMCLRSTHSNSVISAEHLKWTTERWSPCSKSCGKGEKRRMVSCMDTARSVKVVDDFCKHMRKPKMVRVCERNNCKYTWVEGQWSPCSATCGHGKKTRSVDCHKVVHGYTDPAVYHFRSAESPSEYCDFYNKPHTSAQCIEANCNDAYRWSRGDWNPCSHSCGKRGRQIRKLSCINREGREVQRHLCPKYLKPKRKKKCNEKKCLSQSCKEVKQQQRTEENKEYLLSINDKPVGVYCYKMDTDEPEEFISLKPDKENFSEMYDKRLTNSKTCPHNGDRMEDCDCFSLTESSGFTHFWKVRLNITSMQIITDDYTFSRQKKGTRIAFGTAGDCYSETGKCPQGRFSVDLTGTSFRISKNVSWKATGREASQQLTFGDQKVVGRCGGHCGKCHPDEVIGLKVEVT